MIHTLTPTQSRLRVLGIFSPSSKEVVLEYTDGATTLVAGKGAHIREGVVVKTVQDERHPEYGRKIAKSISAAYLLRKNATELQ